MSEFSAFIQHPDHRFAVDYYNYYGRDGRTPIKVPVHQIRSLLDLLEQIIAADDQLVLIVTHGNPNGLILPLAGRRSGHADSGALAILLKMLIVNQTVADLDRSASTGNTEDWFQLLNRTLRSPSDGRHPIVALLDPPTSDTNIVRELRARLRNSDAETVIARARELLAEWRRAQLRQLNITDAVATRLTNAVQAVHDIHLTRVIIRGCNIGQSEESTHALCYFFGARILDAPDVYTVFGFPSIRGGESRLQRVARQNHDVCGSDELRRRGGCWWWYQNRHLSARIQHLRSINYQMEIVADTPETVATWRRENFGTPLRTSGNRFPVHFLLTAPPLYPLNDNWRSHIVRAMGL